MPLSRPQLILKRVQSFEFNDLEWVPTIWRSTLTDAITFLTCLFNAYRPALPVLKRALERSPTRSILDLCSGSGGPIEIIHRRLQALLGHDVHITVTDRYPNAAAFRRLTMRSGGAIDHLPEPIDATDVPPRIPGFRTLFTAFHHFPPRQARRILESAVKSSQGIGVFEYTDRNLLRWSLVTLVTPVTMLLVVPFLRPFSLSRLFWTYCVPLIPLVATWDCLISGLRTYLPEELLAMTRELEPSGYEWSAKRLDNGAVTYLVGYPTRSEAQEPEPRD